MASTHVKADQLEIAQFAQGARKLYITSSSDVNIINQSQSADTTSVGKAFQDNGYDRAAVIYSGNANTQYPEAGFLGVMFSFNAGAATMEFKTLAGDTVDNLTATQITNAKSKNVITYIQRGGRNTVHSPTTGDGTFVDIIRDLDYAASDLQVSIYSLMINLPKIPMTNRGLAIIEGAVRDSALRSAGLGIFDPDSIEVIMPRVEDLSANDRALRKVTGIQVNARMAGAVHFTSVLIQATV